ncbi:hypothetical protein AHAS_Ahas01G0157100 [Arachis hypogaea]
MTGATETEARLTWNSDRYNILQLGDEIPDFYPLSIYYKWYTEQYENHLCLSNRVSDAEANVNELQRNSRHHLDFSNQIPLMSTSFFQGMAYDQQFQGMAYDQEPQLLVYEQQQQYISKSQPQQPLEPYIPQMVILAEGDFNLLYEHVSDFSMDPEAHVDDLPRPSVVLRTELFDLNEYPPQEEGFVGDDQ